MVCTAYNKIKLGADKEINFGYTSKIKYQIGVIILAVPICLSQSFSILCSSIAVFDRRRSRKSESPTGFVAIFQVYLIAPLY
jgi:hypothetical protein